ncbi:MAG: PD-(D/E)XK nuclease family protein [Flavobacteriaceae bacterium]
MTKQLNSVSNLLEHTNLIRKKYDEFAEYTGENFNVFSILGLYSHELSHSTFIGNLLNAKGKHGQKDVFLKLFIEEVKELFQDKSQLENFETSKSFVITEKYTGNGYIDIFITNGRNSIIIENKVWAGDQHQQLVRYNEFEKKCSYNLFNIRRKRA